MDVPSRLQDPASWVMRGVNSLGCIGGENPARLINVRVFEEKMSELEKANILHALEKNFTVSPEIIEKLLQQISDDNVRNNYTRIKRGLTTEDNYRAIFSALPWIKNINGLQQEQEKHHKETYQTPDYSLLVENSNHKNFPILVDVKTVTGEKESCEIMPKQMHTLRAYARDHQMPLLFAIYWERFGYWTHTSFKNFGGKKNNRITWREAISNDLSHALSDYSYIINKSFYRKTLFSKIKPVEPSAESVHHGYFSEIFVGTELDNLKSFDIITSSAIDAIFKSRIISQRAIDESTTEVIEIFENARIIKISNWLINFINIWNFSPDEKFGDMRITTTARIIMVNLMHELGFGLTYLIPTSKNEETKKIFELAYNNTWVMERYNNSK